MIHDCFVFFNEYEAMTIRLNELYDVVDHFVIVVASHTFRGERYKPDYLDFPAKKTTLVEVTEALPENPWEAEKYVRNQIMRGLTRANPDDLVVISDADEIPRPEVLATFKAGGYHASPYRLIPRNFSLCLDWESPEEAHRFPVVVPRWYLDKHSPHYCRENTDREMLTVTEAGWHFSSLGGPHRVSKKLRSFAHDDLGDDVAHPSHILRCIQTGRDLLGRWDLIPVEVDNTYPQVVYDHPEAFKDCYRRNWR